MDISEYLLRRYVSKIFSRFESFLQSNSVATSKLLILLHLVFSTIRLISSLNFFISRFLLTGLNSELLVLLMERTNFGSKRQMHFVE